jgi:NAD(P)-dependent dehydrogenase (short-subunit alcohol dehydrogenase family)
MNVSFSDLPGKVAAITGGGGVLCSTIAAGLAEQGVQLAILDIRQEAAQAVAGRVCEAGGRAIAVQCDVLDKQAVEAASQTILGTYGRIDILINGAGGNKAQATTSEERSFFDMPVDALRWVFDLNFLGTVIPCQVFGKLMAEAGQGCILNISSMTAFRPVTRTVAYCASKAAVSNFTQWLAVYLSQAFPGAIRVNALAPGFFCTEQNQYLLFDRTTGELSPRGRSILAHTPMSRFGDPEDLIATTLWLVSEASRFVHGAIVPVDGGFLAYSGV